MTVKPIKIGVAGTHSTGKSTLLAKIGEAASEHGLAVGRISDLATRARELGFPILTEHTYESTLWIMAEGLRQEAEASLSNRVILVDRPLFDAVGYFEAALEISGRQVEHRRVDQLRAIARAHSSEYDFLVVTILDQSIPLGPDRDQNDEFRRLAGQHIHKLAAEFAPHALRMTSANADDVANNAIEFIISRIAGGLIDE